MTVVLSLLISLAFLRFLPSHAPTESGSETERGSDCGEERGSERGSERVRQRRTRKESERWMKAVMGGKVTTLLTTGDTPSPHPTYHESAQPPDHRWWQRHNTYSISPHLFHPSTIPKWWSFQVDNWTGQKLFQWTPVLFVLYEGNWSVFMIIFDKLQR